MKRKSFWAGVAVLAAGLIFVTGGGAATMTTVTLTVNSTADSTTPCTVANHKSTGTCTLRGAILYANNLGNDNTMFVIKLAAKTYHLSLGTLDVDGGSANTGNIVQIVGATKTIGKRKHKKTVPASIIDGSGNVKPASVFQIDDPTQMYNVVITGGTGNAAYASTVGAAGSLRRPAPSTSRTRSCATTLPARRGRATRAPALRVRRRDLRSVRQLARSADALQDDGDAQHRLLEAAGSTNEWAPDRTRS